MATQHEIVGEEWKTRASELAAWAMSNLINRKDVWGQYSVLTPSERRRENRSYKAMTLPQKDRRGEDMVTLDKLTRHFASRHYHKPQIIGLHAKSPEGTSRWLGIDIDCHDTDATAAEDHQRRNLTAAINWWRQLQDLGYDPLLFDSNGAGGYHLWVLFAEPAPTTDIFAFAKSLVDQWEHENLDEEPETFPKRFRQESLGSWFRLPGLHHTREHYSTVWSGDEWLTDPWLSGHAAIDTIMQNLPGPPPPATNDSGLAEHAPRVTRRSSGRSDASAGAPKPPNKPIQTAERSAAKRRKSFAHDSKATVCVDLDGVLCSRLYATGKYEFGDPVDGALEFTQTLAQNSHIIIYSARLGATSTKSSEQQALADDIAQWLDTHGFVYDEICTDRAKPIAKAYIDDRAVPCRPEHEGPQSFTRALVMIDQLCRDSN